MRWASCLVACLGLALATAVLVTAVLVTTARAQPPSAAPPRPRPTLVVSVTPTCAAAPQAAARFTSVLAATERESGEVRVSIQPHADGFALHFLATLPDGQTERELTDPDCAALLSASVLLAAIALDVPIEEVDLASPETTLPTEATPPEGTPPEGTPPEPTPPTSTPEGDLATDPPATAPITDGEPPVTRAPLQVFAHATVGLASPLLPALRPDGGVGLALYLPRPRASLGVVGAFRWTGPGASGAPLMGVRVRARALGVDLGLCAQRPRAAWALDACGGVRVWRVRGQGVGSDRDQRDHALDVAVWASVGVTWFAHARVGVRAAVGGAANVLRARLNVIGLGALHTAPALQLEGSLGLWVRLGPDH